MDYGNFNAFFRGKIYTELKKIFGKHLNDKFLEFEIKGDNTPVTILDKKIEQLFIQKIQDEFPSHSILGEEYGMHNKGAEYQWIIDPIDGTKDLLYGGICYGTIFGLLHKGIPILGGFYQPLLDVLVIGDNSNCYVNNVNVKIADNTSLEDSILLITDYNTLEKFKNIKKFNKLKNQVKFFRTWGNCYGYYLVLTGKAHIMIDPIMSSWDMLPIIPIVKGAGGCITDYEGNDVLKGNSVVATSNLDVHRQVIDILNT